MSYFVKQRPGDGDHDEPGEDEYSLQNQWISFGSRVAIRIALHPFEYAKVLIQVSRERDFRVCPWTNRYLRLFQLGYEPIKPRMGKTLFGQPALVYPNVFQYGEIRFFSFPVPSHNPILSYQRATFATLTDSLGVTVDWPRGSSEPSWAHSSGTGLRTS